MREAASRGFFLGSKAPFGYTRVKVSDGVKERPTLEVDPESPLPSSRRYSRVPSGATVWRKSARS